MNCVAAVYIVVGAAALGAVGAVVIGWFLSRDFSVRSYTGTRR